MIHACGGNAVLIDLNATAGEALAQELGEHARFVRADVSSPGEVEGAVRTAVDAFGGVQIAVSCAGLLDAQKVLDRDAPASLERFSRVIQVNLVGTFNVLRLAAAAMRKNEPNPEGERGVVINTSSVAAFEGQIGQAAYSASKGGVASMTLPIARELARYGIRVMAIAPGLFDTAMLAGLPEPVRASLGAMSPFPPRLGRPSEYAMLVRQIIENPMLNGEVIRLDGGIRMAAK
jgi:NAD(P)-dependent dehydrogenase (short-subunit alcohol dehydrogenase family)